MSSQFDDFSKNLSKAITRREALRIIGSSLLGAFLAVFNSSQARAQRLTPVRCENFCRPYEGAQLESCMAACTQCRGDIPAICRLSDGSFFCCGTGGGLCQAINDGRKPICFGRPR